MAWAEVSLATSLEHEEHIDALHKLFYDRPSSEDSPSTEEYVPRSSPWVPHLSLLYDNPGKSDLVLFYHVNACVQYEVLSIWILHLTLTCLYLITFANHMY